MSLINRINRSAFSRAMRMRSNPLGLMGPATPASNSPNAPRTDVSGVRSSCDTVDTNSLFMRFTCRSCVTSRIVDSRAGTPSHSTGRTDTSPSNRVPSFRTAITT